MRSLSLTGSLAAIILTAGGAAAQSIGTNYCTAVPNSTGVISAITASGSTVVQLNNVTLECADLPLNSSGFFLVSRDQGFVVNPGGSTGNLCLGGSIGRYSLWVLNAGGTGQVSLAIDLATIPHPTMPFAVIPGDTLNFQYWHRDGAPGGGATSNLSEGLEVGFTGGPPAVSWSQDVYPLLTAVNSTGFSCVGCHGGTCNLDLGTASTAYTNMVNVTSSCCTPDVLVVPNDANSSLLYTKIVAPTCGQQMPLVGSFPGDPNLIRDWINAGALNN